MGHRTRKRISAPTVIQEIEFAPDSPQERTGFEPSVPPRKRQPSREAPRPTIVVSRDDLCLMTPSSLSVRHLSSATAERPYHKSGTDGSNPFPSSEESCELRIIGLFFLIGPVPAASAAPSSDRFPDRCSRICGLSGRSIIQAWRAASAAASFPPHSRQQSKPSRARASENSLPQRQ